MAIAIDALATVHPVSGLGAVALGWCKRNTLAVLSAGVLSQVLLALVIFSWNPRGSEQEPPLRQLRWVTPITAQCCCPGAGECILREWVNNTMMDVLMPQGVPETLGIGEPAANNRTTNSEEAFLESLNAKHKRLIEKTVTASAIIPDVEDAHLQLRIFLQSLITEHMETNLSVAQKVQEHSRAAELGIEPVDRMDEVGSMPLRIHFLNSLAEKASKNPKTHVCIYTTCSVDLMGVRREILPWIQYHTELGVVHFYILYDGHDPDAINAMMRIRHLTLIHIHAPHATDAQLVKFRIWSKMHWQWGGRPGNYELMVKQGFGAREAINSSIADGMDWIVHIDPDEFLYPDNPSFSVAEYLAEQAPHVSSVRFMNFEGQPEAGDLINRYEQVTLFRSHRHFVTPEAYALRSQCKLGDNKAFLLLYANGKSAARVDAPGLRHNGPHYFAGAASERWITPDNPKGEWRDSVSNTSILLHYAYSYLSDVVNKSNRSCPMEYLAAARNGDREKVKECFVIDFDQDAYMATAVGDEVDFFYSRNVLSNGVRLKCRRGQKKGWCLVNDVEYFKYLLIKTGLMRRIREPQQILRSHERQLRMVANFMSLLPQLSVHDELEDTSLGDASPLSVRFPEDSRLSALLGSTSEWTGRGLIE